MTKKILITGAGGAIGVHMLAKMVKETDWQIIATDSFRHKGEFDRIVTLLDKHADQKHRVTIFTHDLTAPFSTRDIEKIGKVDYIVNLASLSDVQDSIVNPAPFILNNTHIALNMLELARQIKPETFVQFSTDEVYGPDKKEGHGHPEWDVILPSNPYAASKAAQEAFAIAYWRSYGVPVIITNLMNNFGEMQAPSKFPAMIQKKIAKGEKIQIHCGDDGEIGSRFYIHSENTADAIIFLLTKTKAHAHAPGVLDRPDRYNIVGTKQLNNLELAKVIAEMMGLPLDYELVNFHSSNPGHDLHYGLDGTKLAKMGWKAPVSFEDSMLQCIEWQKENAEWMA